MEQNKLDTKASEFMSNKKASSGGTVSFVIGIVIVVIVIAKLALPSIKEASENLSGTEKTMILFSGTLLVIFVIVLISNNM
jgi:hypothetical protein